MAGTYTKAQANATRKYLAKTVSIQIRVTEEKREEIRAKAEARGESLTEYIKKAIEERG